MIQYAAPWALSQVSTGEEKGETGAILQGQAECMKAECSELGSENTLWGRAVPNRQ